MKLNIKNTLASTIFFYFIFASQANPPLGWSSGVTTRYWDCCKPSCGWWGKAPFTKPVIACDSQDSPVAYSTQSACQPKGGAYTCSNQRPFQIARNLSLGFAAVRLRGKSEADWCCKCYRLRFLDPLLKDKEMIVQATNTGWDLSDNHFDIAMPGGGQGMFQGCSKQFVNYKGGVLYGGVSSSTECYGLPKQFVQSCLWRFEWFMNANNPNIIFKEEVCPQILTSITKCQR